MSGECNFGKCDICGREAILQRKYYRYDIKCECHSPTHFEFIEHCDKCEPKEPTRTRIQFKTEDLKAFIKERDDLRRQVESLTKVKHEFYENMLIYKKACDDLVILKEKQYDKIDKLESQNATLRGALEKIRQQETFFELQMYGPPKKKLSKSGKIAAEAITASGDNRYARIEEAAKEVVCNATLTQNSETAEHYYALEVEKYDKLADALGEVE